MALFVFWNYEATKIISEKSQLHPQVGHSCLFSLLIIKMLILFFYKSSRALSCAGGAKTQFFVP